MAMFACCCMIETNIDSIHTLLTQDVSPQLTFPKKEFDTTTIYKPLFPVLVLENEIWASFNTYQQPNI